MKRHAWFVLVVGLSMAVSVVAVLRDAPRAGAEQTYTVKPKQSQYPVKKNFDIDYDDEEAVAPEGVESLAGGKIKITTKTFKPPTRWWFTKFGKDQTPVDRKAFNPGSYVDIEIDPECLPPKVTAPTVTVPKDGSSEIRVILTELTFPPTAGNFPLKCEGNLQPPQGGAGSAKFHWAVAVFKEPKAYSGNAWWGSQWGHASEIKALIDDLGYDTLKEEPPTKASAIAAAPPRVVWYSLSDGREESGRFVALCFGYTGWDPLYAADLPGDLHYVLVFANACKSATGDGLAFANKFGAAAYLGWIDTVGNSAAVDFSKKFFANLKGRRTVGQAVNMTIESYQQGSLGRSEAEKIRVLRGGNVVVEQG
jgi:hypothetical protein